jgi:hypothetical protein
LLNGSELNGGRVLNGSNVSWGRVENGNGGGNGDGGLGDAHRAAHVTTVFHHPLGIFRAFAGCGPLFARCFVCCLLSNGTCSVGNGVHWGGVQVCASGLGGRALVVIQKTSGAAGLHAVLDHVNRVLDAFRNVCRWSKSGPAVAGNSRGNGVGSADIRIVESRADAR